MAWSFLGVGLAAAAALLLLARVNLERGSRKTLPTIAATAPAKMQKLLPDGITRVVYDTSDDGLIYPANASEPVRRVRSRSRETLHWKDASSGASLRVSYPTEEVELIPISLSSQ